MNNTNVLINNIKQKISEQAFTLRSLEKKAGLKNSTLHFLLSGRIKNPSLLKVISIAKALNCSLSDLLHEGPLPYEKRWDPSLYCNVLSLVGSLLDQKNLYPSKKQIDQIIEDIYFFSVKLTPVSVDESLVNFVIEKSLLKEED